MWGRLYNMLLTNHVGYNHHKYFVENSHQTILDKGNVRNTDGLGWVLRKIVTVDNEQMHHVQKMTSQMSNDVAT